MDKTCVVRVAVSNNFNCTEREFRQLDAIAAEHPDKAFFVNCNVRTPRLRDLLDHCYKAVVTLNPELSVDPALVRRGFQVARSVAFYRVKWLPFDPAIIGLAMEAMEHAPVVVTSQRFNSRKCLERYTDAKHYKLECARFRLHGAALRDLTQFVDGMGKVTGKQVYLCDRKGLGCLGCGLCATLNGHKGLPIRSLNLSASGVCPYSCPDCYAKAMQKFLVATGNRPMEYDVIKGNKKQLGKTKHIQDARRKAA